MESDKTTTRQRQDNDKTTTMSILTSFDTSECAFDKSELRSFERFSFPPLSDLFPDVPSFRSLGTRSRRTTSHIVLPDEPLHTESSHTASSHTASLHTEPTAKVPIYGGILHTVYEGVDYYALVQGRHTGKWSFPKGHLQLGETGPECALREIAEETGMDEVDHERSIGTLFLHYGTYYLYECSGFDPLLPRDQKEIVHAKWMTLEEMRGASLNADVSQFRKQRCRVLAWSLTQSVAQMQSQTQSLSQTQTQSVA
jgi:8-oxo-dGTP pyrophosphatase MutT (NUDIX family)